MKAMRTVLAADAYKIRDFPLSFQYTNSTGEITPHDHEMPELVVMLEGTTYHATATGTYPVSAGSVIFVPPGVPHGYPFMHGCVLANVLFEMERILPFVPQIRQLPGYRALFGPRRRPRKSPVHFTVSADILDQVRDVCAKIDREARRRLPGFEAAMQCLVMYFVVLVVRGYRSEKGVPRTRTPENIAKVVTYINEHFVEPFDADKLATMAGLSRSQFFRAFKQDRLHTPLGYVTFMRVSRAEELLRTTDKSVTEIAFEVGFDDSSYFARQFRKWTKMTPRAYRREVRRG